ncbi:MAG: GspE/PulE family protein, partial [Isosphaeraceae bacterium]
MIRPRLALATFALVTLGAASGADAAEPLGVLIAQSASIQRGPGLYLNLLKFLPVLGLYLLWVKTTHWAEDDMRELNNVKFELWNSVLLLTGVLGFVLLWAIPIFPLGVTMLLLLYLVPLFTYCFVRNQTVPDDQKVLTAYHLGEVTNNLLAKMGVRPIFNRNQTGIDRSGPPIQFIGKSQGALKEDPDRVARAEESRSYMAAKELVYDAVLRRSTDIHLEPTADQLSVRYRIDGMLHAAEPFDRPTGDAVVNVFKVLSALDISEKRKPQDGSFGAKLEGRELEFRVATSGSKGGEKLVMRILDSAAGVSRLDDSGMRPKLIAEIRSIIAQPHGMFLCCGPTGSGKSTTLYAGIREIDRYQKNIITVEDPIEYQLDNVTQIEINTKGGQ